MGSLPCLTINLCQCCMIAADVMLFDVVECIDVTLIHIEIGTC
jgi:hypothetical protein